MELIETYLEYHVINDGRLIEEFSLLIFIPKHTTLKDIWQSEH